MDIGNEFQNNPEILRHYDLLQRIGVIDTLSTYHRNLRNMEELISDAIEIFNRHSIDQLIDFITGTLVDHFVPQYLQFVFTPQGHDGNIKNVCFHNLKKVKSPVPLTSIEAFRRFFTKYPGTIGFSLFEYSVKDPAVAGQLAPLEPEIIVPVSGPEELYGIIIVGKKVTEGEYTNEEIVYIDRLMKFVSVSIQNTIHYTSSVTDYKTQLYNHSFFIKRLSEEVALIERHEKCLSILLMEIDRFKRLNDRYGHLAGDTVLFHIARKLEASTRREDVIARFGGEEFIVLLPESGRGAAYRVAERIRTNIERMRIPHNDDSLRVTVSIGANTVNHYRTSHPNTINDQADEALYTSKKEGRNRTTHFRPGLLFRASELSTHH